MAFEILLAQRLGAISAPIASLEPRLEPRLYERDVFAVTFWTYCNPVTSGVSPSEYADALCRLHAALEKVEVEAPHFTERVAAAEALVTNRDETPALGDAERGLLLETLRGGREAICSRANADQLLHGEPHPGNLLGTRNGLLFIDFETCCRGPIELDVAYLPEEVSGHYPDVDSALLQECRHLVLAMVAAWRWDQRDEFPNGRQHGLNILDQLRSGPPWPALGALATG